MTTRNPSITPISVGDVARILGLRPSRITQLFYERKIPDENAPIVCGRRLIPPALVPEIKRQATLKGWLNDKGEPSE